jgi:tetratricopeptide (TPR) repeat protein
VTALDNYGDYLRLDGRLPEAIEFAERARKLGEALVADHPTVTDYQQELGYVHGLLGDIRATTGRFDEADASFSRAMAICDKLVTQDPDRNEARDLLGQMYSRRVDLITIRPVRDGEDRGRAIRLADQAVARCPKKPVAWRTLGRARYHARDWKGALTTLEKARSLGADEDCDLWLLLALTHGRLGHHDQAQDWYQKALAWMKVHPAAEWSRERLVEEAATALGAGGSADRPGGGRSLAPG